MEKDADAYRTISEVAETLDIPPHVLRFWETKFPQIKPLKRGGGRRYYRRSDTELLRAIRRLLYDDGYTIRGVQRLLRAKGVGAVAAMLPGDAPPAEEADAACETGGTGDDVFPPAAGQGQGTVSQLMAEIAACRAILDDALRVGDRA